MNGWLRMIYLKSNGAKILNQWRKTKKKTFFFLRTHNFEYSTRKNNMIKNDRKLKKKHQLAQFIRNANHHQKKTACKFSFQNFVFVKRRKNKTDAKEICIDAT